jgi:hypothetical protein
MLWRNWQGRMIAPIHPPRIQRPLAENWAIFWIIFSSGGQKNTWR